MSPPFPPTPPLPTLIISLIIASPGFLPSATYAFLNFASEECAVAFWEAGVHSPTTLRGNRLFLNWAKAPPIDPAVLRLIEAGATRHLLVGNISESTQQQQIAELFKQVQLSHSKTEKKKEMCHFLGALPPLYGTLPVYASTSEYTCVFFFDRFAPLNLKPLYATFEL